jgi:hypothetical protein
MHRFMLWISAVFLIVGLSPGLLWAQEKASETDVKAAFVYNFAKFVEWPASAVGHSDSTFRIGIVGSGDMNRAVKAAVESKQVAGRRVEVVETDDPAVLTGCQLAFFNPLSSAILGKLLAELQKYPVLTVGDQTDFIAQGGMIRFFIADGKVRFEISPKRVRSGKINISSKLLKLAVIADEYGGTE